MQRKLKSLILAGGRGKRLEKVSSETNKCMQHFNGRPLISYSLKNAVEAEIDEIVIVVGYKAEDIINHFGNCYENTRIRYVIQKEQKGLVHAIECSREAVNGSDFITFLGDEILIEPRHKQMIDYFYREQLFVVCGVTRAEDISQISKTYAVMQDDESNIFRLIEKPRKPMNTMMGTGNCIFRNSIFDYIKDTPINQKRGEKELVDLIQCAVDDGNAVKSFNVGSTYININTKDDIEFAERLFKVQEN